MMYKSDGPRMFVEDTSTKDRVSPDFQTPRREMKIRSVSGVFLTNFLVFRNLVKH